MERNKKDMLYSLGVAVVLLVISVICWLKPADDFSITERRQLKQFPEVSLDSILDGAFMSDFEAYAVDQFPFRDEIRSVKTAVQKYLLGQSDNNGVYMVEGHLGQMDATLSKAALQRSVNKLNSVYETYIKDSDAKVYFSIIPDKNYFLAKEHGYLTYEYEDLYSYMQSGLKDMNYIEIRDLLLIDDYYRTDSHWKQECIVDVAERLSSEMGNVDKSIFEVNPLDVPFYGVYYGQAGLSLEPDTLNYLSNSELSQCRVYDHENQREIPMYDLKLATGRDGYEMYLSGALSAITIENPEASTMKELVIFRDSFSSSLAPLLATQYAKVTLLDVRYLNEGMIDEIVHFTNQDVLFLYSTSVLNNEASFR